MSDSKQLIGTTLDGKYTIVELIGEGGMGAVYKAQHDAIKRTVAIKFLHLKAVDQDQERFLKRFTLEAQTASQIRHPSAITIYDYGVEHIPGKGDTPYLVMEYIDGQSLKEIIKQEGRMAPERLIPLVVQVCGALGEAHGLNIVHRDLKPDNIMVSKGSDGIEWALVLDFGIAKQISDEDSDSAGMTKTGSVMGTPRYMAPEQIWNKGVDGRSDLYALAIVIYEALTGTVPFEATSLMDLAIKQSNEDPEPILTRAPDVTIPKSVERVIMRALSRDADQRQSSALEFSAELLAASPKEYHRSGSYGVPAIGTSQKKAAPWMLGAVGVLLLAGVSFAAVRTFVAPTPETSAPPAQGLIGTVSVPGYSQPPTDDAQSTEPQMAIDPASQKSDEMLEEAEARARKIQEEAEKRLEEAELRALEIELKAAELERQAKERAEKQRLAAEKIKREAEKRAAARKANAAAAKKPPSRAARRPAATPAATPSSQPAKQPDRFGGKRKRRCGPTWCP